MSDNIKEMFDNHSSEYDRQRKQLIPCFDDFYQVPLIVGNLVSDSPNILDVGAGTGLFSSFFLKAIPNARLTLIDLSEKMLEIAGNRFRDYPQTRFIVGDYVAQGFPEKYELIISSLSIHHLTDQEKAVLFKKCYDGLLPGGVFVNADQVLGSTPFLDQLYKQEWIAGIIRSGLKEEDIQAGYERMKLDKEAGLADQLAWLREAGFTDVDCIYKYYNFAVMIGRKRGRPAENRNE